MHPESSLNDHLNAILGQVGRAHESVERIIETLSPSPASDGECSPPMAKNMGIVPMSNITLTSLIELNAKIESIEELLVGRQPKTASDCPTPEGSMGGFTATSGMNPSRRR